MAVCQNLFFERIDTRVLADQRESCQIVVALDNMLYQDQKAAQQFYVTFAAKSDKIQKR